MRTRITLNTDTFHTVQVMPVSVGKCRSGNDSTDSALSKFKVRVLLVILHTKDDI